MPAPLLGAIGIAGIGAFLQRVVVRIIEWWLAGKLAHFTLILTTGTVILGLFAAFMAAQYAALQGLTIIAPPSFTFALSFLPPSALLYSTIYMTAMVSKRTFDWTAKIYMETTKAGPSDASRMRF